MEPRGRDYVQRTLCVELEYTLECALLAYCRANKISLSLQYYVDSGKVTRATVTPQNMLEYYKLG